MNERDDLIERAKRMSAAATMMMGKSERDAVIAGIASLQARVVELEAALKQLLRFHEANAYDSDVATNAHAALAKQDGRA